MRSRPESTTELTRKSILLVEYRSESISHCSHHYSLREKSIATQFDSIKSKIVPCTRKCRTVMASRHNTAMDGSMPPSKTLFALALIMQAVRTWIEPNWSWLGRNDLTTESSHHRRIHSVPQRLNRRPHQRLNRRPHQRLHRRNRRRARRLPRRRRNQVVSHLGQNSPL